MKKKVKCLLFSPHFHYVKGSIYREISNLDPPLGLISLAAYLNEKGFNTQVFDLNVEIKSSEEFPDFLDTLTNHYELNDVVFGISFLTPYVHNSYAVAKFIKQKFPDSKVVAGGAHATFMAEEVLNSTFVDVVVRGEGEISLFEVLAGIPVSQIQGISYREINNGVVEIVNNSDRERIKDINTLPFPAYEQL
ncbi:MAG TPA: cobalamin-dependent protein, partial [Bacteroidales bacterium]|nr:cobalamin-dependent protein [Bacteroidales bacterium]